MAVKKVITREDIQDIHTELNRDSKPRLLNPKPDYCYVWVHYNHQLITKYLNMGFRLATKSDVEVEGLKPSAEGHWESGVDVLMCAPKKVREDELRRQQMLLDLQMGRLKTEFHNEAYKLGVQSIETERDDEGKVKIIKG